MLNKIGFATNNSLYYELVDELLEVMKKGKIDYTNTFNDLSKVLISEENTNQNTEFSDWIKNWKHIIRQSIGAEKAIKIMGAVNPITIPRNHLLENALDEAVNGNMKVFERLLDVITKPYELQDGIDDFLKPSESNFENNYQTFCGT